MPSYFDRALIEPWATFDDPLERGAARLLASTMLLAIAGFAALDVSLVVTREGYSPPPAGYPALAASYLLSRCARPRWGAAVVTAMFVFVPFGMVGLRGGPPISLSFSSAAPVFAGIFLGGRAVLATGAVATLLLALVPYVTEGAVPLDIVSTPMVAVALTTAATYLHKSHRDWIEATRRREIERHELQVRQLQKVEAIGRFAGGIAHDFNNVLAIVGGCVELVRRKGETHGEVETIETALRSARDLTAQLLALSRESEELEEETRPAAHVAKIGGLIQRIMGDDVEVAVNVEESLPAVRTSPGKLEQILLNLATNARDAMREGGRFEISARAREGGVEIVARDTGHGMDEATLARIFEPFFTTKPEGEGSGLGLSVVFGIVSRAGGVISVDSEPAKGTGVRIWLPGGAIEPPEPR